MMAKQTTPRADQDSPWKIVLRQYSREAIEFFFPNITKEIDWGKTVEFLDKEFQQIALDAEVGKRFADQLVKVHHKRRKELILLIHIEVQAIPEKSFPERMFTYSMRIFEYFHQPPISLAILCDAKSDWRPSHYEFQTLGSSLRFDFTSVKLLDYASQWVWLEQSQNPFAIVVMAHLKTQETKRNATSRKAWKFTLVKRLYEKGYSRSDVLNLFKFVDWIMILPEGFKQAFWEELKLYEEERRMPYITSVEEIGYERGIQAEAARSLERGRRLILLQLEQKLGSLPQSLHDRIANFSIDQLETLAIALLNFSSIDDLTHWLGNDE